MAGKKLSCVFCLYLNMKNSHARKGCHIQHTSENHENITMVTSKFRENSYHPAEITTRITCLPPVYFCLYWV